MQFQAKVNETKNTITTTTTTTKMSPIIHMLKHYKIKKLPIYIHTKIELVRIIESTVITIVI